MPVDRVTLIYGRPVGKIKKRPSNTWDYTVAETPEFELQDDPQQKASDQERKHAALRYILDAWQAA